MLRPRTIKYGDREVPVIERGWRSSGGRPPYPQTYALKPGQRWKTAPTTMKQSEHYVVLEDGVIIYPQDRIEGIDAIPVGAAIARELIAEGAQWAVWTECWGGLVLVGPDLVCVDKSGEIGDLFDRLRAANTNRWGGTPDAVAQFANGRVAMRDGKRASKDFLQKNQHEFARAAERLLGDNLDLAVVEWAYPPVLGLRAAVLSGTDVGLRRRANGRSPNIM
jgi:hypothetical protein